ncbi:uncharacterized protein LOC110902184 isoform X2 [Helianthus annuus]|uniref:uncharacterized protein LOC110902184 isoform X2 n=1 Tax=Helianthus annuus TaxID=4232 RepID=UPI001652ED82|nr:uncharacterized protein LOC110902184 isoform X2 [Helianthus annuus]
MHLECFEKENFDLLLMIGEINNIFVMHTNCLTHVFLISVLVRALITIHNFGTLAFELVTSILKKMNESSSSAVLSSQERVNGHQEGYRWPQRHWYVKCGFAGEKFSTSVFSCVVGILMLKYEEPLLKQKLKVNAYVSLFGKQRERRRLYGNERV